HEVEDTAGVAPGEQERDARDQDEQPDEPAAPGPAPVLPFPREPAAAAREHPDDDVLGNREQPPLHEDEAPRQALGVLDVERGRVVRVGAQREGRIAVGPERAVRVEADAPRPAEDADVEVEERPRVAAREQDREERDHAEQEERDPEKHEHDVVRDREQPLDEPEPAARVALEPALDADGIGRGGGHRASFSESLHAQRPTTNGGGVYRATQRVSRPSAVPRATNSCAIRAVQPSCSDPCPAWGTTSVRLAGSPRGAARTFARGSCGSSPPTTSSTGRSARTRAFDHAGCAAFGIAEHTIPARAASAAVRSARYVSPAAVRVRAGFHRAHGSLQTIDQNISCPVATPPVPVSSIVMASGSQSPPAARWAIHGIRAAPDGVRVSAWIAPAASAGRITIPSARTGVRRSARIISNASLRTRGYARAQRGERAQRERIDRSERSPVRAHSSSIEHVDT